MGKARGKGEEGKEAENGPHCYVHVQSPKQTPLSASQTRVINKMERGLGEEWSRGTACRCQLHTKNAIVYCKHVLIQILSKKFYIKGGTRQNKNKFKSVDIVFRDYKNE